jgi:hypothetical protein
LILDERTRPFDLLTRPATNQVPGSSTNQAPNGNVLEGKTAVSKNEQ